MLFKNKMYKNKKSINMMKYNFKEDFLMCSIKK